MPVVHLKEVIPGAPFIVTIGNFDGLHLGHQTLIQRVLSEAALHHWNSALVTFDPHPREFLRGFFPKISTPELQQLLFKSTLLHQVHLIPFTQEIAEMEPETFVEQILLKNLPLAKVIIGYDFKFGKNRTGDQFLLEELGKTNSFEVETVLPFQVDGKIVGSSLIRKMIEENEFLDLPRFLGRPYSLYGTVVKGDQQARHLGVPTANLSPKMKIPLGEGVYLSLGRINGNIHYGITNVGKYCVDQRSIKVETHLFQFERDLYGSSFEVIPLQFLRPTQHFPTVQDLKDQIQQDLKHAQELIDHFPSNPLTLFGLEELPYF